MYFAPPNWSHNQKTDTHLISKETKQLVCPFLNQSWKKNKTIQVYYSWLSPIFGTKQTITLLFIIYSQIFPFIPAPLVQLLGCSKVCSVKLLFAQQGTKQKWLKSQGTIKKNSHKLCIFIILNQLNIIIHSGLIIYRLFISSYLNNLISIKISI